MSVLNFLFKLLALGLMSLVGLLGVMSIALGVHTSEGGPCLVLWLVGLCFLIPAIMGVIGIIGSPPVFGASDD